MCPRTDPLPRVRVRLAVAVLSAATIALELALMRVLAVRFWHHFAYMAISVALLGFGASGTALALARRRLQGRERAGLCLFAFAFAATVPLAQWGGGHLPLAVQTLAWTPGEAGKVLLLEAVLFVPFLFAGAAVGVALMDRGDRVGGHYAANLAGSGLGGVAAVLILQGTTTGGLLHAVTAGGVVAALVLVPWRRRAWAMASVLAALGVLLLAVVLPQRPVMSPYKMLEQVRAMPETRTLAQREGPLGRLDVVQGEAVHYAPGLSLQYTEPLPAHVLLIADGDGTSAVYDVRARADWAFLDFTTGAAAYGVCTRPRVLVVGAGGGADIGLALYHRAEAVTALEMNRQVIDLMTGPLHERGGRVYTAHGVRVVNREARGYLASTPKSFDLVHVPPVGGFGASGAGLYAAQESYLYTAQSFAGMLDRLAEDGVLSVTRWVRTPPREGPRLIDTLAAALRARTRDPARHLAVVRSWATVTALAFDRPITDVQARALREFSRARSFDLVYLPELRRAEANQYHVLDRPRYFEAAQALLGPDREQYLERHLFDVSATTDDRPYFFHFFRWRTLRRLVDELGNRARGFLELGYLLLVAALVQAMVLAVVFVVLPLAPRAGALAGVPGRAATMGYFVLLGAGFMFLEMGFLQKLILYLAHPVYAAAAAISSFLVFGGLGSYLSGRWQTRPVTVIRRAAAIVVGLAVLYAVFLDPWLALTQPQAGWVRFLVGCLTIAPLATAMGHLFPAGLVRAGGASVALVPWAWAANGFASVAATVAAPLVAMEIGFLRLVLIAAAGYALAGLLASRLPGPDSPARAPDG